MTHAIGLVALLEKVPALLECVVCGHPGCEQRAMRVSAIRALRLVDKESSRMALLALRECSLIMKGGDSDTNLMGTRLLKQANLHHVKLKVAITGEKQIIGG